MVDSERVGRLGETCSRDEKDSEYVDLVEVHGRGCSHQSMPDINTQIQGGTATQTLPVDGKYAPEAAFPSRKLGINEKMGKKENLKRLMFK